jgi:hypothetical protein
MPWRASRYCNRRLSPRDLDHIADQLIVVLNEMRSYTSAILGSMINGGPHNSRFMPCPWNPPHAFSSVEEYLDYYHSMFSVSRLRQNIPHWATFSLVIFSLRTPKLQEFWTGRLPGTILSSGNIAGCMIQDGWHLPGLLGRIFPGPRREKESKPWGRLFVISITTIRAWASVAPAPVSLASTRSSIVQPKLLLPISSTPSGACQRYAIRRSVSGDLRGFTTIFWFRILLCRSLCAPEGYSMGYMSFDCTTVYQYWD